MTSIAHSRRRREGKAENRPCGFVFSATPSATRDDRPARAGAVGAAAFRCSMPLLAMPRCSMPLLDAAARCRYSMPLLVRAALIKLYTLVDKVTLSRILSQ